MADWWSQNAPQAGPTNPYYDAYRASYTPMASTPLQTTADQPMAPPSMSGPPQAPQTATAGTNYTSWWDPNDPQGSFSRLVQGKDASSQTLQSLAPYLQAIGGKLENPNAAGYTSKIILPNGQIVRVGNMFDAPGAQTSWGWTVQPNTGTGGGATFGAGTPGASGGPGTMAFPGGGFSPVAPYQAPPFEAPTGLNYMNDPGYEARLKMGTDAIQHAAAARGGILSGGTLKALARYGQDYGTNEFGNVFNRQLQTAGYNAGVGQQGYQNRYGQYTDLQDYLDRIANRGAAAARSAYQPPSM